jgi:hypothetical protein
VLYYELHALKPIKPLLILPEVLDQSKWYGGEDRYIDPEKRYIFAFVANSQSGQIQYNRTEQVDPAEFKSFWDLLNPKWKGKMAALHPTTLREGQIALQKLGRPDAHNSRRIDIAKNDVDPYNRLEEGKKYFDLAKPEYQDLTPIFKVVKEALPQK